MSKELYNEMNEQLQGRCYSSRKVANNTYIVRRGNDIAVVLHETDVLTVDPKGYITLDSGGWKTPTTKDRINNHLPGNLHIYQENSQWYLASGQRWTTNKSYVYEDGMQIGPRGKVYARERSDTKDKKVRKLVNAVNAFCKELVNRAFDGRMDAPSRGDCWYCCMKTSDGETMGDASKDHSHIRSHIKEKYYVPSLFWNAMEEGRDSYLSGMAQSNLGVLQARHAGQEHDYCMLDVIKSQYVKAVKVYIKRRLGLPS